MPDERGWDVKRGNSLGGSSASAGRSETRVPDERGWDVKRGNSLGGAPQEGQDRSAGRAWMGCEAWK